MCGLFNGSVNNSDYRQFSGYVMCNLHKLGRTEKLLLRLLINNIYNTNVVVIKVNNEVYLGFVSKTDRNNILNM